MSNANSQFTAVTPDDEIALYRPLTSLAIASLVLGLLSLLSFAPTRVFVWIFPPAAVATGLLAIRKIRSAPDVWAGLRFAQLGIGLAILSAVGATVHNYFESSRISRHGKVIADRFVERLTSGDIESAFWLTTPREARRQFAGKTSSDVPMPLFERYSRFYGEARKYAEELSSGRATVEFDNVEDAVRDQGTEYALVVYKYRAPENEGHMLVVAASYHSGETHQPTWFISEQQFEYTPGSYARPVSSGHGHAH